MKILSMSRFAIVLILGLAIGGSGFADDKKADPGEFFAAYAPRTNGAKLYFRRLKSSAQKEDVKYRAILGEMFIAAEQAVKDAEADDKGAIQKDAAAAIEIWSYKYGQYTDKKADAAAYIARVLKGFKGEKDECKPVDSVRAFRAMMNREPKDLATDMVDKLSGKKGNKD